MQNIREIKITVTDHTNPIDENMHKIWFSNLTLNGQNRDLHIGDILQCQSPYISNLHEEKKRLELNIQTFKHHQLLNFHININYCGLAILTQVAK